MQQTVLLSLPNSGSTWFANLISNHSNHNYYDIEFFNPLQNTKYRTQLQVGFGCELIGCYRNIVQDIDDSVLEDIYQE